MLAYEVISQSKVCSDERVPARQPKSYRPMPGQLGGAVAAILPVRSQPIIKTVLKK